MKPRHRGIYVIVNWELVLHQVSSDTVQAWVDERYHTTCQAWTQCGQEVTGFIDDGDIHTVNCIRCFTAHVS